MSGIFFAASVCVLTVLQRKSSASGADDTDTPIYFNLVISLDSMAVENTYTSELLLFGRSRHF